MKPTDPLMWVNIIWKPYWVLYWATLKKIPKFHMQNVLSVCHVQVQQKRFHSNEMINEFVSGGLKLELFFVYCYNIFVFWSWGSHYMCLILNQERKCRRVAKTQAWFSEGWGPLPQASCKEKVWGSNLGPCKNHITKIWSDLRLPLFYTFTYSCSYQGIWPNSMSPVFVLIQS